MLLFIRLLELLEFVGSVGFVELTEDWGLRTELNRTEDWIRNMSEV